MVILEPEFVDYGYQATTQEGSLEVIRFRDIFYQFSRKFQSLKAAIDSCRHDIDHYAVVNLVIEHQDHAEIWTQLSPEVSVQKKGDQGESGPQSTYFRGRPMATPPPKTGEQVTSTKPKGRSYRGLEI
ncbi:MAG: hypothetical protein HC924_16225 [Synechococcaceae cyanobacterium SM2_3_2]|nr:hypothetical protein [Synechococcaceae cyanobacterium SM2_3_2]